MFSRVQAPESAKAKSSTGFGRARPARAQITGAEDLASPVTPTRSPLPIGSAPHRWPPPSFAIFGPAEAVNGARRAVPGVRLQPKLAVGSSSDPLEQEADRVAEEALGSGRGSQLTPSAMGLSRKCAACGERDEEEKGQAVQRRVSPGVAEGESEAPPIVEEVLRGGAGRPLDGTTRAFFEHRLGHDFGGVRVHTGSRAAESARAVGAQAYTVGRDIVFGEGKHAPEQREGRRLLAHELAHVVQQRTWGLGHSGRAAVMRERAEPAVGPEPIAPDQSNPREIPLSVPLTKAQQDQVNTARAEASNRLRTAHQAVSGVGAPPPGGSRPNMPQERALQARRLVERLFGVQDPDMGVVATVINTAYLRLPPQVPVVAASPGDRQCGPLRDGYVADHKPPIVLCPHFFQSSPEQQALTMVHEAMHLAGIGEIAGESYCNTFDCETPCGGTEVADAWAHLVHCLSGQPPQKAMQVQVRPPPRRP
jgi:hypothetical protein